MPRQKEYPKKIIARATEDEHARLLVRAEKNGLSMSRFLIECALSLEPVNRDELVGGSVRQRQKEEREQREWAINELARVGNNLNQAVRRLNMQTGTVTYKRLNELLEELSATFVRLRRAWERPSAE